MIDHILSSLSKVSRAGSGKWMACCPAHDDRSPSLSITENEGGSILMHCFAGCRTEDVLKAIGLTMKDLVPPSFTEIRPQSIRSVREAVNTQPKCTRNYAKQLWLAADNSDGHVARHPYAKSKGITWAAGAGRGMASGRVIGKDADCLIIPCRDLHTKSLLAVQAINRDGEKQTFGSLGNGALVLGNTLDKSLRWFVV